MTLTRELDVDERSVVVALRRAVEASGLTQQAFARAVGTSPSRLSAYLHGVTSPSAALLMRYQRIGAALGVSRDESVPTPLDCASSVRLALSSARRSSSVLRFALEARDRARDTLRHRPHLLDAWDARATVGDERWDTLLAALIAHEFEEAGRRAPEWTRDLRLDEEWMPAKGRATESDVRRETPPWLAERNILLAESALAVA